MRSTGLEKPSFYNNQTINAGLPAEKNCGETNQMIRTILSLTAVLVLSTVASASLHTFDATPAPGEQNVITILGSSTFELGPSSNGFQFPVVPGNGLDIQVVANTGPVNFSLVRGATVNGSAVLVFANPLAGLLRVQFFNSSVMMGDAFPDLTVGVNGTTGSWNAPALLPPTPAPALAGRLGGGVTAVPEPSAFAFGGLAIGLVAAGRFVRRKLGQTAE